MSTYLSMLSHGETIYTPIPCPLDNQHAALFHELERVRREMGAPFADRLDGILRVELHGTQSDAFRDGFQLGGLLMLNIRRASPPMAL